MILPNNDKLCSPFHIQHPLPQWHSIVQNGWILCVVFFKACPHSTTMWKPSCCLHGWLGTWWHLDVRMDKLTFWLKTLNTPNYPHPTNLLHICHVWNPQDALVFNLQKNVSSIFFHPRCQSHLHIQIVFDKFGSPSTLSHNFVTSIAQCALSFCELKKIQTIASNWKLHLRPYN
jgi:hypothetical protein